jgi:hypothetical protein
MTALVNFEDIPYFTLVENIAPLLSEKEFGALSMMSTYLRDVFMSNDVWRRLYIQTNLDKFKITDKSVHVGPGIARHKARVPCDELPIVSLGFGNAYYWHPTYVRPWPFMRAMRACGCVQNRSVIALIANATVQQIRDHPITPVVPAHLPGSGNDLPGGGPWQAGERFHAVAVDYNRSHGHTHSHVCTNIDHYLIDTLDAPKSVRNFKDYRRQTLSKKLTKTKHDPDTRKAVTSAARKKKKVADYKRYMRLLKAEIAEEEAIVKKNTDLQDSLKVALKKQ